MNYEDIRDQVINQTIKLIDLVKASPNNYTAQLDHKVIANCIGIVIDDLTKI